MRPARLRVHGLSRSTGKRGGFAAVSLDIWCCDSRWRRSAPVFATKLQRRIEGRQGRDGKNASDERGFHCRRTDTLAIHV